MSADALSIDVTLDRKPGIIRQAVKLGRVRLGLGIAGLLFLIALVGPFLAPFGSTEYVDIPNVTDVSQKEFEIDYYGGNPVSRAIFDGRSIFGTDYFGQDVLSRFLFGGRSILILAAIATALALIVGSTLGLLAAYLRGKADEAIMRTLDVMLSFPQVLLSLVVISMFGPSRVLIIFAVGFSTTPRIARIVRGAAVPVVERDFISAAEAIGESRRRVLFNEILPNVSSALLVEANLRLTYSIGLIAALAFLGFTPDPNAANWGLMIQENRVALTVQPWGVILPTVAIALLTIGTGLIGDGLSRVSAGIDRGGKGE
jgi:peptide/nickel transport system permease protein